MKFGKDTHVLAFDSQRIAKIAKGEKPIVLALESKHYQWVQAPPGVTVPRQWLSETVPPHYKVLAGAAALDVSEVPPSSPACTSSLEPRTPSVHSLGGSPSSLRGWGEVESAPVSVSAPSVQGQDGFPAVELGCGSPLRGGVGLVASSSGHVASPGRSCPATPSVHSLPLLLVRPRPSASLRSSVLIVGVRLRCLPLLRCVVWWPILYRHRFALLILLPLVLLRLCASRRPVVFRFVLPRVLVLSL